MISRAIPGDWLPCPPHLVGAARGGPFSVAAHRGEVRRVVLADNARDTRGIGPYAHVFGSFSLSEVMALRRSGRRRVKPH